MDPPLKLERYAFLIRKLNPYFKHGVAEYFLARQNDRVVGRITAQIDRAFNEYHGTNWGMFGFLEFENEQQIVDSLLDAAADWLAERGCERMLGPMDFSMNEECGVLIDGFELEPMIKQPWHPPYYRQRLEAAGLTKAKDILHWELHLSDRDERMKEVLPRLAKRARDKHRVTIRRMSRRRLRRKLDEFADRLQRGLVAQLGVCALLEGGPRRAGAHPPDRLRPQLVHDRRTGRPHCGNGDHHSRHQPGAQAHARSPPAARVVAPVEQAQVRRQDADRVSRRFARVRAHRGGRRALHGAFRNGCPDGAHPRRGRLDPRVQPLHEPRARGDGRPGCEALPDLQARLRRGLGGDGPRHDGSTEDAVALTVVGSIAFDAVETPFGERERMLGGSAVHFALAASFFTDVRIVGPVGDDFGEEEYDVLRERGVDTDDIERVAGGKTFFWARRLRART